MSEPLDAEASDERTPRQALPNASTRAPEHRHRLHSLPWRYSLVSILVAAGIIGAALALGRSHEPPVSPAPGALARSAVSTATASDFWGGGTPVAREAQAGGLDFVLQVMPGPYFLGQLLAANLSLRNDSHTTYTLSGPSRLPDPWVDGICGTVIFLTISGGSGPQYVPPVPLASAVPTCPYGDFPLAPGQTMTVHKFVPVPNTGELTLQSGAYFTQTVTSPDGSHSIMAGHSPLDGRWPSIKITVAATPPPDRQITLQRTGTQVQISAPTAARAHLYSIDAVTCNAVQGGPAGVGSIGWKPIATTVMPELTCGDSGTQVTQWWYVVSAPGYAIASGHAGP